jgi:hypothetical protein
MDTRRGETRRDQPGPKEDHHDLVGDNRAHPPPDRRGPTTTPSTHRYIVSNEPT